MASGALLLRPNRMPDRPKKTLGRGGPSWDFVEAAGNAITLSEDVKQVILLSDFNDTDIVPEQ